MKRSEMSRSKGVSLVAGAVLALCVGLSLTPAGCGGNGFLGLEDYQRDILVWLVHSGGDASGVACWDLNGNGVGDPQEDQNGDGLFNDSDCQGLRCWDLNGNGVGDPEEDINGDGLVNVLDCQGLRCWDLNGNGVGDPEEDINEDGLIDTRDCGVELVFVLDTSDSMRDDITSDSMPDDIGGLFEVIDRLIANEIVVRSTLYGIDQDLIPDDPTIAPEFSDHCSPDRHEFTCVSDNVRDEFLTCMEGPDDCPIDDNEDWGPATEIVAKSFPWLPGVVRIVIPISDEDPEDSLDAEEPPDDSDIEAINAAILAARVNHVFVIPIVAEFVLDPPDPDFEAYVSNLADCLADDTGASSVKARFPSAMMAGGSAVEIDRVVEEVLDAITNAVTSRTVFPDCNGNEMPDACDIARGTSEDCNLNGTPDECDIADGTSADADLDGVPDECVGP